MSKRNCHFLIKLSLQNHSDFYTKSLLHCRGVIEQVSHTYIAISWVLGT